MTQQFEPFQKILVRDSDHDNWRCGFFSHIRENYIYKYVATEGVWAKCIPYEGNESLVGTSDSPTPPEPEFKFGDRVVVRDAESERWYRAVFLEVQGAGYFAIVEKWTMEPRCWRYCRKADW